MFTYERIKSVPEAQNESQKVKVKLIDFQRVGDKLTIQNIDEETRFKKSLFPRQKKISDKRVWC